MSGLVISDLENLADKGVDTSGRNEGGDLRVAKRICFILGSAGLVSFIVWALKKNLLGSLVSFAFASIAFIFLGALIAGNSKRGVGSQSGILATCPLLSQPFRHAYVGRFFSLQGPSLHSLQGHSLQIPAALPESEYGSINQ